MPHARFWLAPLVLCLSTGAALADTVFNCAGPEGRQILQDVPCPSRALLWLKNGSAGSPTGAGPSTSFTQEPTVGMTTAQVRALLGAPAEISAEEVVEGRTVVWTYPDARAYQFDAAGVLVSK